MTIPPLVKIANQSPKPRQCQRTTPPEAGPRDSVAPGVTDMRGSRPSAFSTAEAAHWAVDAAVRAASMGTFGVGGALLGPHRELLALSCNRVLADGQLADPTAHGERQLVDWYFEQKSRGQQLPPPEQCTIVSSLDPCMMCAGSILTGGFKVVSATLDTTAGVNYSADGSYPSLPADLRAKAQESFGYFGVEGGRSHQGPGPAEQISSDLEKRSLETFLASLKAVQEKIHATEGPAQDLRECRDSEVLQTLQRLAPEALQLRFDPGQPGPELAAPLLQAARGGRSAAALLDPFGNLVMLRSGQEQQSPTRTAFMELTRDWAALRRQAGPAGEPFLRPLKECTVVSLWGPAADSTGVMELGAYGSSVEGPLPESELARFQYVLPRQSAEQLGQQIEQLPPLYSQIIRPRVEQVKDPLLVQLCQNVP